MGRGDLTAWAAAVGRGGVPVPAGAAAAGDVRLQACPDPGRGLSILAAEYPPAVPPAHCPSLGDALSRDLRDAAGAAGASLYGGRLGGTGHALLAAGRSACYSALGSSRGDWPPHQGAGGARDPPGKSRASPARAGLADYPWASVDGGQGLCRSRSATGLRARVGTVPTRRADPAIVPGVVGISAILYPAESVPN